jgi:hypothetical protein
MFRAPTPEEKAEFFPAYGSQLQALLCDHWEEYAARQRGRYCLLVSRLPALKRLASVRPKKGIFKGVSRAPQPVTYH